MTSNNVPTFTATPNSNTAPMTTFIPVNGNSAPSFIPFPVANN